MNTLNDFEKLQSLLIYYNFKNIEDLYNYIDYLENVKSDYEFLKRQIDILHDKTQELF